MKQLMKEKATPVAFDALRLETYPPPYQKVAMRVIYLHPATNEWRYVETVAELERKKPLPFIKIRDPETKQLAKAPAWILHSWWPQTKADHPSRAMLSEKMALEKGKGTPGLLKQAREWITAEHARRGLSDPEVVADLHFKIELDAAILEPSRHEKRLTYEDIWDAHAKATEAFVQGEYERLGSCEKVAERLQMPQTVVDKIIERHRKKAKTDE